jgi:hypothetical protein
MTFAALFTILIQVGFAVHVVRTGRNAMWLWIIIFVPLVGCLVYFIAEILPEAGRSQAVHRAKSHLVNAVDPGRELRRRREALEATGTVENRVALADECVEARMYDEAITLYRECLVGIHKDDPAILIGLARAQFEKGAAADADATLNELLRANPDYKPSPDTELLRARILESLGRVDDACREYETLKDSYPGEEARVRYALLLTRQGDKARAQELFRETLTRAKRAPRYYRQKESEWIKLAESNTRT